MMIVRIVVPTRSSPAALPQRKYARTGSSLIAVTMKNFQKLAVKSFHARPNVWPTRNSL